MAQKVDQAGRSGVKASNALQEKLNTQRRQFENILNRLERAEKSREKEIARLEKENTRLKSDLAAAVTLLASEQKKTASAKQENLKLSRQINENRQQMRSLEQQINQLKADLKKQQNTSPTVKTQVSAATEEKK